MKNKLSVVFILLAGALWGSSCLFVSKLTQMGFSSLECTAIRIVTAAVILNAMLIIKGRGFKYYKISLGSYLIAAASGICSVLAMCVFYYSSMLATSAAVSAILLYTAPLFVMVMSLIFFKEKLSAVKIAAFVIAIVGCALVSGVASGAQMSGKGLIFGVLSGFTYSLYGILTVLYMKKNSEPLAFSAQSFAFAAIGSLFLANPVSIGVKVGETGNGVLLTLLLFVVFSTATAVLPFVFYTYGLSGVKPSTASILAFSEPLTAAVLGVAVLHQRMDVFGVVGIVLVVVAIVMLSRGRDKN